MPVYAIGDIQGCDEELGQLLESLHFSADRDQIWFVGDLVNRGPNSLAVLRRVRAMGGAAIVTLGNHDLHLLAIAMGAAKIRRSDTLDSILKAADRDPLLEWLAGRPLLHEDAALGCAMVHAGLAPQWDMPAARGAARELESALRRDPETLFAQMYGDQPDMWSADLSGSARLRFIANCLTRLRYVDANGRIDLREKSAPSRVRGLVPWFQAHNARWRGARILFGHWSTLGFVRDGAVTCLDTGCVWGGQLTALRVDVADARPVGVACQAHQAAGD
jgi:bis(5'-nucleosyl)-tetraphosphatase (symmetrical)